MKKNDEKFIIYCILREKYLKNYGVNTEDESTHFDSYINYFPFGWETNYSNELKIKYLIQALIEKKNLKDIVDEHDVIIETKEK